MTSRTAARIAWALTGFSILIALLVPFVPVRTAHGDLVMRASPTGADLVSLLPVGLLVLGALVVSRQPTNPIGWIFTGAGLAVSLQFVADMYVTLSLRDHVSLPGATYAAWWENLTQGPVIFGLFATLFLLFPNGRVVSARWRPILWLVGLATGVTAVAYGLKPGPLSTIQYSVQNPFGVSLGAVDAALTLGFAAVLAGMLLSAVSLVVRFRRSRGEERQQLKWVVWAGALAAMLLATGPFFWFGPIPVPLSNILWNGAFFLAIILIPVSIGVAMLRYRLYDVDLLINRTLVYGSLTVSLGAVYLAGVVALQALARAITGQSSDIAVAVVTLTVAALFSPWRRRLQTLIDRRFYRRKYDAARTLATFSSRLRDEVDLDALSRELVSVLVETVQPADLAIWLLEPGRSS
jgi:hypothetical protein